MAKITREVIVCLDLWKQHPELLPADPLLAAIEVASVLNNASENLIRLADMSAVKLRGKHLRHCLTLTLPELIGLLNLMEQRLEDGNGWEKMALIYDANGVEFQGRHAGSFALVAFDYAYELSASFADEKKTDDGDLRKIVDVDWAVANWVRIRQQIQAMPRIDLPQLTSRVCVEGRKLTAKRKLSNEVKPTWSNARSPSDWLKVFARLNVACRNLNLFRKLRDHGTYHEHPETTRYSKSVRLAIADLPPAYSDAMK